MLFLESLLFKMTSQMLPLIGWESRPLNLAVLFRENNNRQKTKSSSLGSELEFSGQMCCDPQQIVTGWGQYFQKLYSDTERSILMHISKAE